MAIALHFNANRAFDLATYASIVLTLACDIKGSEWAKYDRPFRQAAAVNPQLPWHRREQDIWMMSVTELTSLATARPPSQQSLPSAQRSMKICRKWNSGLPLWTVPILAHVLYMPGARAHHPGLPTCQHVSQGPSHHTQTHKCPPLTPPTKVGLVTIRHSARRYCTIISDDGISMPIYIYIYT